MGLRKRVRDYLRVRRPSRSQGSSLRAKVRHSCPRLSGAPGGLLGRISSLLSALLPAVRQARDQLVVRPRTRRNRITSPTTSPTGDRLRRLSGRWWDVAIATDSKVADLLSSAVVRDECDGRGEVGAFGRCTFLR